MLSDRLKAMAGARHFKHNGSIFFLRLEFAVLRNPLNKKKIETYKKLFRKRIRER